MYGNIISLAKKIKKGGGTAILREEKL